MPTAAQTRKTNPHAIRWNKWLTQRAARIRARRGGYAAVGRAMLVSRQTASAWMNVARPMPDWAAVEFYRWWHQTAQKHFPPLLCPPGE